MALPVCRIQSVSFTRCIVGISRDTRYMDGDEIVQKKEQMRLFVSLCYWVFGFLRLVMYRSQIYTNRIGSDDKSLKYTL